SPRRAGPERCVPADVPRKHRPHLRCTLVAEAVDVAVVGAGQAGLSLSHELSHAGIEHVVFDRGRVGQSWRGRWDSFCLVIPNWTVQLPGGHYQGDDPDGFMPRDDIVRHLVDYAHTFQAPLREETPVFALRSGDDGFVLSASSGEIRARQVVLASGGYQKPHRPPGAGEFPAAIRVIDANDYASPSALPSGKVLVMGSGQTGCQIAEELHEAGRDVFLACGRAPWIPRQLDGRDTVAWLVETPFLEATMADLPDPRARRGANPQASGRRGGHDLPYRTLQAAAGKPLGHLLGRESGGRRLAPHPARSVAFRGARASHLC